MHHDRPLLRAVGRGVGQVEALGQVEVALDGAVLPLASQGVLDLVVDLRAIERAAALIELEGQPDRVGRLLERLGRALPDGVLADGLLRRPRRQVRGVLEPEGLHEAVDQPADPRDLLRQLIGRAEDVRVVLGEAAHAQHPVHDARALVAVDRAELGPAQGQLAVAPAAVLVDQDVARAVHGLDAVGQLVERHGRVHHVAVVLEVTRDGEEGLTAHVGRVHRVVAAGEVLVPPHLLEAAAHGAEGRVPEHEARAGLAVGAEEVEVRPQLAVVPQLDLLEPLEVGGQLLLGPEGGPIDALHHWTLLVAPPVGPGEVQELEVELVLERVDVGPLAQIPPLLAVRPVGVEGDLLVLGDQVERLDLVLLPPALEDPARLVPAHGALRDRGRALGDAAHLLLDLAQLLLGERLGQVEVVVEAVLDRGTEPELDARVELLDGRGHQVRHRVAQGRNGEGLHHLRSRRGVGHGVALREGRPRRPRPGVARVPGRSRGARTGKSLGLPSVRNAPGHGLSRRSSGRDGSARRGPEEPGPRQALEGHQGRLLDGLLSRPASA